MTSTPSTFRVEDLHQRHNTELRRFLARMLRCEEAAADAAPDPETLAIENKEILKNGACAW